MNYSKIKKLDEESMQKLTEGTGPSDKCLCSLLSPPDDEKKSLKASLKRAFASLGHGKTRRSTSQKSIDVPLSFTKGGKGLKSVKEVVKRKSSCRKCGCDNEDLVLKHSYANIRITSPDVSSFCPCQSNCMPDNERFKNNIKVTIERLQVLDVDSTDSAIRVYNPENQHKICEPGSSLERSISSLVKAQSKHDNTSSIWSSSNEKG